MNYMSLTMFSMSAGLCLRTVFTALKISTSSCATTCSMARLAAQYTPTRDLPFLWSTPLDNLFIGFT